MPAGPSAAKPGRKAAETGAGTGKPATAKRKRSEADEGDAEREGEEAEEMNEEDVDKPAQLSLVSAQLESLEALLRDAPSSRQILRRSPTRKATTANNCRMRRCGTIKER